MTAAQDRLGFFGPFMRAWPTFPPATRAQLYTAALEYNAHVLDPRSYVELVAQETGLRPPATA